MERKEWCSDSEEKTYVKKLMEDLEETQDDIEKVIVAINWLKNVMRPNVEEYCEIAKARCENEVKKHENIIP